jgi:hypothetical protein
MAKKASAPRFPETLWQFAFFPYQGHPVPKKEAQLNAWPNVLSKLADLADNGDWTVTNADGSSAAKK